MNVELESAPDRVAEPDPLAPVRRALLERAHAEAALLLAAADADAAEEVDAAGRRAREVRDASRVQGEADAEALLTAELTRSRREARSTVLRAQRSAYDELREHVRVAVTALRDDPGYPAVLERFTARARAVLGPDAVVTEDPAGGIVAEAAGRRVSFSLAALADRVLEGLGSDLEGLWQP